MFCFCIQVWVICHLIRSEETSNDTAMNRDTTTVTVEHDIVYLFGTFHQGDELQFIDYSWGQQCVTNSISAIVLSKICPITEWKTQHLDQILKAGDVLYQQVCPVVFQSTST